MVGIVYLCYKKEEILEVFTVMVMSVFHSFIAISTIITLCWFGTTEVTQSLPLEHKLVKLSDYDSV